MITEEALREADLEKDIPCEMLRPSPYECGQPAAVRIWFRCSCGHQNRVFCCAQCRECVMGGDYCCYRCKQTSALIREC